MFKECTLTTVDNPFNPFDDFRSWFLYDIEKGYNSCDLLGRTVNITDDMTQKEINIETERAIDEIMENDFLDIYKKIYRDQTTNDDVEG
jgi:hypothetical protein